MKQFILFSTLVIVLSSCFFDNKKKVHGDGNITTQTRSGSGFTNIEVSGAIDVVIRQDAAYGMKVETDNNIQQYVDISVEGNTLHIHPDRRVSLQPSKSITVYVSAANFKRLEASGASSYRSENKIQANDAIEVDLSGASSADLDIKAPKTELGLSGASNITIKGETKDLEIDGSGASHVKAFELLSETANVDISGAGGAEVFASVKLKASASGATSIHYKGNAEVNSNTSGASSVNKAD